MAIFFIAVAAVSGLLIAWEIVSRRVREFVDYLDACGRAGL